MSFILQTQQHIHLRMLYPVSWSYWATLSYGDMLGEKLSSAVLPEYNSDCYCRKNQGK